MLLAGAQGSERKQSFLDKKNQQRLSYFGGRAASLSKSTQDHLAFLHPRTSIRIADLKGRQRTRQNVRSYTVMISPGSTLPSGASPPFDGGA